MKEWKQKRPTWCPHSTCQFIHSVQDAMCCGKLPKPEPHDGDFNTHRFCLNGASDSGGVFDLQINKSDAYYFKRLFNAMFPCEITRGALGFGSTGGFEKEEENFAKTPEELAKIRKGG